MRHPACLEEQHFNQIIAITPGSYTCQSPRVNPPPDTTEEDELTSTQGPRRRSNTFLKAPTLSFVFSPTDNLFTKFMKVFIETMQA